MANPEQLEILKSGVENWNRWREENPYTKIDLGCVDFSDIDLRNANLSNADLSQSNLSYCILEKTNLRFAQLIETIMHFTNFDNTDFYNAYLTYAFFSFCYLSKSKNLNKVIHDGPSALDIHTIYQSKGNIPIEFLRGVGMDDQMISFVQSLKGAIQFYSCFISYSRENDDFATLLHDRLQGTGIRCWKDTKDLKTGDFIEDSINKAIKTHEKVLIIFSKESINSKWVRREVKNALDRETKENKKILFPINIDNTVFEDDSFWVKDIRLERLITDFSKWKDHDAFEKAFQKITADLKASENNTESPSTNYI